METRRFNARDLAAKSGAKSGFKSGLWAGRHGASTLRARNCMLHGVLVFGRAVWLFTNTRDKETRSMCETFALALHPAPRCLLPVYLTHKLTIMTRTYILLKAYHPPADLARRSQLTSVAFLPL